MSRVSKLWKRRLDSDEVWKQRTVQAFPQSVKLRGAKMALFEVDEINVGNSMIQEAHGPGGYAPWKTTFAQLYLELIRRNRTGDRRPELPLRFVLFAALSALFVLGVMLSVVPMQWRTVDSLLRSVAPAILTWVALRSISILVRSFRLAHPRILRKFYSFYPYVLVLCIAYEAFRVGRLSTETCPVSGLLIYLLSCLAHVLNILIVASYGQVQLTFEHSADCEGRLLMLLARWYTVKTGSALLVWMPFVGLLDIAAYNWRIWPRACFLQSHLMALLPSKLVLWAVLAMKLFGSYSDSWGTLLAVVTAETYAMWRSIPRRITYY